MHRFQAYRHVSHAHVHVCAFWLADFDTRTGIAREYHNRHCCATCMHKQCHGRGSPVLSSGQPSNMAQSYRHRHLATIQHKSYPIALDSEAMDTLVSDKSHWSTAVYCHIHHTWKHDQFNAQHQALQYGILNNGQPKSNDPTRKERDLFDCVAGRAR